MTLKKKKVKVDWMIHAIADEQQREDPEAIIEYISSGFGKYGFGEICVVGRVKNQTKIMNLINTFGRMLAEGEKFEPDAHHFIDDKNGMKEFEFDVVYHEYGDGEKEIQLIPDFECETLHELCESIYENADLEADETLDALERIFYMNNRAYANIMQNDGKYRLCRVDKLIWQAAVDNTVDIFDDSWELGYKDGNYKNCALDNLFRIES